MEACNHVKTTEEQYWHNVENKIMNARTEINEWQGI
jgi:hypothetical protein